MDMSSSHQLVLSSVPRVFCEWFAQQKVSQARLWFDQTVCDLAIAATELERLKEDVLLLSSGKISVDLRRLNSGQIDIYSNPTIYLDDAGCNLGALNTVMLEYRHEPRDEMVETGVAAIDDCVRLIRATCAMSTGFRPELYSCNFEQDPSER